MWLLQSVGQVDATTCFMPQSGRVAGQVSFCRLQYRLGCLVDVEVALIVCGAGFIGMPWLLGLLDM